MAQTIRAILLASAMAATFAGIGIGDDPEQFLNPIASDRRDDAKLRRWARIALITDVCWRMQRWRVR